MSELEEKIKSLRNKRAKPSRKLQDLSFSSIAFRASVDMVPGIVVGTFLGYFLDDLWQTGPWLLLIGFILGSGAGFMNVFRLVRKFQDTSVGPVGRNSQKGIKKTDG